MKIKVISAVLAVTMILTTLLSIGIMPSAAEDAGVAASDAKSIALYRADNGEYVYYTAPDTFFYPRSAHCVLAAADRRGRTHSPRLRSERHHPDCADRNNDRNDTDHRCRFSANR